MNVDLVLLYEHPIHIRARAPPAPLARPGRAVV